MGIAVQTSIHPNAAKFINKRGKCLINGQWVDAARGKTFATFNPATGALPPGDHRATLEEIGGRFGFTRGAGGF